MNKKTLEQAANIASEMIRLENRIRQIQENGPLAFDVFLDQDLGWVIQTNYCQFGGCLSGFIAVKDKCEGRKIAAKMTYFGEKPSSSGICNKCREEYYDMCL